MNNLVSITAISLVLLASCQREMNIKSGYYFWRELNTTKYIHIKTSKKLEVASRYETELFKYSILGDSILTYQKYNDVIEVRIVKVGEEYRLDNGVYCYVLSKRDKRYIDCLDSIDFNINRWSKPIELHKKDFDISK